MPRTTLATAFSVSEHKLIEEAAKKLKVSRYKFLQQAALEVAKGIIQETEGEKTERERKNNSGTEGGRQKPLKISY